MIDYIPDPKTAEEALSNVRFQFDNVRGWMLAGRPGEALAKLNCLIEACVTLKELLEATEQGQQTH